MIPDIAFRNGKIICGEKMEQLINEILDIFANEQMSYEEAKIVLEYAAEGLKFRSRLTFLSE